MLRSGNGAKGIVGSANVFKERQEKQQKRYINVKCVKKCANQRPASQFTDEEYMKSPRSRKRSHAQNVKRNLARKQIARII